MTLNKKYIYEKKKSQLRENDKDSIDTTLKCYGLNWRKWKVKNQIKIWYKG